MQGALDNTRSLIATAVDAALVGMDDGTIVSAIDLSSITRLRDTIWPS